jgi:hypothetical protein
VTINVHAHTQAGQHNKHTYPQQHGHAVQQRGGQREHKPVGVTCVARWARGKNADAHELQERGQRKGDFGDPLEGAVVGLNICALSGFAAFGAIFHVVSPWK